MKIKDCMTIKTCTVYGMQIIFELYHHLNTLSKSISSSLYICLETSWHGLFESSSIIFNCITYLVQLYTPVVLTQFTGALGRKMEEPYTCNNA